MTRARDVANLIGSGNYSSTTFTATAGQTAFTISHTQGFIQVFMNGLLLDETVDYTSNGSAVTLTSGAAAGDEIEVVAYNTFSVGDALNQAAADTRYVNTSGDTMTGDLSVTGDLFVTNSTNAKLSVSDNISEVGSGNLALQAQNSASSALKPMGFRAEDFRYATGSSERMRIDGSGRVTMPNQPVFQAYNLSSGSSNINQVFPNTRINEGNHYSTSTGRFTAPVAGKYLFGFGNIANSSNGTYRYYIRKNGSNVGGHHLRIDTNATGSEYGTNATYTFPLALAASDYVNVYYIESNNGANTEGGDYAIFWGYLIG